MRRGITRSAANRQAGKVTVAVPRRIRTARIAAIAVIATATTVTATTVLAVDYPQTAVTIAANALRIQTATVMTTAGIAVTEKQIQQAIVRATTATAVVITIARGATAIRVRTTSIAHSISISFLCI